MRARHHHDLALAQLGQLPASETRDALARMTALAINREY
jgi:hypothetical protein